MSTLVFLSPWVLLALAALPLLWWLLRATPPSPKHLRFPGVRLLLGVKDVESMPDRTPIWLLLLRMVALAAAIFAFAEPVANPEVKPEGRGPLLILMDGGWASASDWQERVEIVENFLDQAARSGRPTMFASLAHPFESGGFIYRDAEDWLPVLHGLKPQAWAPDRKVAAEWVKRENSDFETYWLTDGVQHTDSGLAETLAERGPLRIVGTQNQPLALLPLELENEKLSTTIIGLKSENERSISVMVHGRTPVATEVLLQNLPIIIPADNSETALEIDLPVELRNRVTRIAIEGQSSAGAVVLADDATRRRKVALVGAPIQEGPQLVAPLHFLRKALEPSAVLIEGEVNDVLLSAPDVVVLPDVGQLSISSTERLLQWIEDGGVLVRFAGPKLAAAGAGQVTRDPLLPVRLRAGGRSLGGAMSWTTPKRIKTFPESSPFFGLTIPEDVQVRAQVVAQPDPELPMHTIAALEDGTPLITQRQQGDGRLVLFHVSANAEWSSLPLSGLFVQMLERLSIGANSNPADTRLDERSWMPEALLDGFGNLQEAPTITPVSGPRLMGDVGPDAPAGLYTAGEVTLAVNVMRREGKLEELSLPVGMVVEIIGETEEFSFKPMLLLAALSLFMVDIIATLWVTGRLSNIGSMRGLGTILVVCFLPTPEARADDKTALIAANQTVLAYVITGDTAVDTVSEAGLQGLSSVLYQRTSIEPVAPIGVDVEVDEISYLPMLYWPISENQRALSSDAIQKLNRYLSTGGMIVFDTRDAQLGSGFGVTTVNGRILQSLTEGLDIPALAPVPAGHTLTRAFYLLEDFPGRWSGPDVWVEAPTQTLSDTQTFGNLNDGVTPVIIGANDWASAWAVLESGQEMFPVGRGLSGQRQREIARRFGVNLVMYVTTGNYKSDQVHVPEFLERMGE